MRRLLVVAAVALVLPAAAHAKGPFQVCGASGCVELASELQPFAIRLDLAGTPQLPPSPPPGPYFTVRWGHGLAGFWVPGPNALFLSSVSEWVSPLETELALLRDRTTGLTAFPPPKHAVAMVNWDRVRNGDGYLRLLTVGTPVAAAPSGTRWVDVRVMGGASPWNDGSVSLSIARSGYLLRANRVYRISPALARRVFDKRPLG
jgi:hypothetical protein